MKQLIKELHRMKKKTKYERTLDEPGENITHCNGDKIIKKRMKQLENILFLFNLFIVIISSIDFHFFVVVVASVCLADA